jgi:hypothetical protein
MATASVVTLTAQQVSHAIITGAMKVHTELGPGLLESTYTACLQYELRRAGVQSTTQVGLPVVYCGVKPNWAIASICWWKTSWWWRLSRWKASLQSIRLRSFRT